MAKAILTADLHIRETQPLCRTDDFVFKTQWQDLQYLKELQQKHDCPVFVAGDLFNYWKPSPWLLTKTMEYLPDNVIVVAGQHDLPQHSFELMEKSGIKTLEQAGMIEIMEDGNFNQPLKEGLRYGKRNIGILHQLVWDGEEIPWPGCDGATAEELLDKYPQFDLIVTGDHHRGFIYEKDGRMLVNPGCFNIQDAKYIDYPTRVYIWDSEDNSIEYHFLYNNGSYTREYIDEDKDNKEKMDSYINWLKEDWEKSDYSGDEDAYKILEKFFQKHKTKPKTKEIIYKALEKEE